VARKKSDPTKQIAEVATETCGFDSFRPGQDEAIRSVVEGRDTLVVKPTGSGKSAIYQIAAAIIPGPTIVVSPLIALQKDQADSIAEQDVGDAAVVNSTQRVSEVKDAFERLEEGDLEFMFITPEQLRKPEIVARLKATGLRLFVVDEAHCISEWGHDFRPDYMRLGGAIEALGHPTVLAMTATAAGPVRDEIVARLGMRDPNIIVRGFDRPNIRLSVQHFAKEQEKREKLFDEVEAAAKPGIVYVATRKHAEEISAGLGDRGVRVLHYHGGMNAKERCRIQDDFMSGAIDVIVATNAFGMGVDKPNVRFVFHYDISDSIDSYYQEIGRAGRDGNPSNAVLFYRPEDLGVQKFFKGGGKLEEAEIRHVAEIVANQDQPVAPDELKQQVDVSDRKLTKILHRLEEVGAVEQLPTGEVTVAAERTGDGQDAPDLEEAAREAAKAHSERKEYEALRIEKMRTYAELNACRREYLLNYFGEEFNAPCGNCDYCLGLVKPAEQAPAERRQPAASRDRVLKPSANPEPEGPFALKSRVVHKEWGKGVVEGYDTGKITVLFDDVGRKTLSVEAVLRGGLLEQAA
jgi:ATP-dependent DNA helicase RecQ